MLNQTDLELLICLSKRDESIHVWNLPIKYKGVPSLDLLCLCALTVCVCMLFYTTMFLVSCLTVATIQESVPENVLVLSASLFDKETAHRVRVDV